MKKLKLKNNVMFKLKKEVAIRASIDEFYPKVVRYTTEKVFLKLKTDIKDSIWIATLTPYWFIEADIQKSIIKKPTFLTKIKKVVYSFFKWFKINKK